MSGGKGGRLDQRQTGEYLRRINAPHPSRPDVASLAMLQIAHLKAVPFENLDIHRGVKVVLDLEHVVHKVVDDHRGGYCYELNSAFAALLTATGYGVDLVSARVAGEDGGFKQDFGHMALLVRAVDHNEPLLVDVGFGDSFTAPLALISGSERLDRDRTVRLVDLGAGWLYQENRGDGWRAGYMFNTEPRHIGDFAEMNRWQQTAPESHFTRGLVCSMLTEGGRTTIAGNTLIITRGGSRVERRLDPAEVGSALRIVFGIALAS